MSPKTAEDLFGALSDPTRREILEAIAERGPITATELARGRSISRQATSKHLGILAAAGIVEAARDGREVRYRVRAGSLDAGTAWLTNLGERWERRFEHLRRHVGE